MTSMIKTELKNEEGKELRPCVRCHSTQLLETYFSKNRRGEYYKTCDRCRLKHHCDQCEYKTAYKSSLITHMRTHTGEKPYACERCDMSFRTSSHLTTHMRTHTGEKPYTCETCEKSFARKSDLTIHKRTHTKEKPYECSVCGKCFSDSGNLTTHMRTHTGEKPFKCETCDKSFSQASSLTTHMRTHTGEKPFKCETCDKSFSQSVSLTNHMRIHTGEKAYACDQCDYKATLKSNLTRHMKTCTGELNVSSGELAVMNALDSMDIKYTREVSELKNDDDNRLRFDFKIVRETKTLYIEYDGRQHTQPVQFGGMSEEQAQAAFEKCQHHDELKNKWCAEHDHPLLRIPYTQFGNITQLITEFMTEHTDWGAE